MWYIIAVMEIYNETYLSQIPEDAEVLRLYLKSACIVHKSRSCFNADEYLIEVCGKKLLLKTYAFRNVLLRVVILRRILRHEWQMLKSFGKMCCVRVPRVYGIVGNDTLVMEYIEHTSQLENPRHHRDFKIPPCDFFTELVVGVRCFHACGLAHGDIRRANILVGVDGHGYFIDFASSIAVNAHSFWLCKYIYTQLCRSDMYSLSKIVLSYYPDWPDEELRLLKERQPLLLRLCRMLRRTFFR